MKHSGEPLKVLCSHMQLHVMKPIEINFTYRVIQDESAILLEMIVCVILSKKFHINMCQILDGYGVMGIF